MKRIALLFAFCLLSPSALPQGPLTPPPGTPAPTMKTLQQVEARTDLNSLAGDAATICIITAPGSYYLTADLVGAAGKDTIRVATAGRVTIDLNGFALTSTGTGRTAILLQPANDAVVIRNGIILAGGTGTVAVGGSGNQVTCEDLNIVSSTTVAIQLGDNAVVVRCRVTQGGISLGLNSVVRETRVEAATVQNVSISLGDDGQVLNSQLVTARGRLVVGTRGLVSDCQVNSGGPPTNFSNATVLQAGSSSVVRNCTVKGGASVDNAVGVGGGSVVSHCRISSVFRDGITAAQAPDVTVESCTVENFGRRGIQLGPNARVRDCTVNGTNTITGVSAGSEGITVGVDSIVSGSSANGTNGTGISAGDGCTITDSTASQNNGTGIQAGNHAVVEKCNARTNQGDGIIVAGSGLVRDCVATGNGKKTTPINAASDGIEVTGGRTRVIDCTTFSNAQHGILSSSTNNRNFIEGCLAHGNAGFGIFLQAGAGDTVIKNQVGGNTGGTINLAGGNIAPIVSASTAVGSMHPLANFP